MSKVRMVTKDELLHLDSGQHHIQCYSKNDLKLELVFEEKSSGELMLEIIGNHSLDTSYYLFEDSSWDVLIIDQSHGDFEVVDHIHLKDRAKLVMNYAEVSDGKRDKNTQYYLEGENAQVNSNAAILNTDSLDWVFQANHQAKNTFADLKTHAIVLDHAYLNLDVIGKIDQGFSGSETHQTSRIMNLGESLQALVHPQLLIEENDVAASHAATVGQPNKEHVYYLQSRGIAYEQAMKLMIMGYLMPLIKQIENKEIQKTLREKVENKVFADE